MLGRTRHACPAGLCRFLSTFTLPSFYHDLPVSLRTSYSLFTAAKIGPLEGGRQHVRRSSSLFARSVSSALAGAPLLDAFLRRRRSLSDVLLLNQVRGLGMKLATSSTPPSVDSGRIALAFAVLLAFNLRPASSAFGFSLVKLRYRRHAGETACAGGLHVRIPDRSPPHMTKCNRWDPGLRLWQYRSTLRA